MYHQGIPPGGLDCEESDYNAGERSSAPGVRRSLRGENGNLLKYTCLENPMNRGAWQASPWGHKELETTE